jgi:hypothetical protein
VNTTTPDNFISALSSRCKTASSDWQFATLRLYFGIMIFARKGDLAAGRLALAAALIRVRGAIDIAGALVRMPTSTRCVRAFSLPSKWEAQEIVTGENKQLARRLETLPTRFPCFRYTTAQQPTSLRRKLSPTLRWPIGGDRSFYSPKTAHGYS